MIRLITVKGVGSVSVKPDLIIITMNLESHRKNYEETMAEATRVVKSLQDALTSIGFEKSDLKTTNFNVRTHYENYRDKENNYKNKFDGYVCSQTLKLEFDFDTEAMGKALNSITKASINPQLNIQFSVKDKSKINEELLINATENARSKAEVLAKASGASLGELMNIDYDWDELQLYSPTRYEMEDKLMSAARSFAPDIVPDNINVSDTVSFVWEIK